MPDKKAQAMHMYLNESCTQRHIATTLGVSERTLYSWIQQNSWDRLKQASLAAPVIIADNMCFQLLTMQQAIAEREPGQQFPTMQEAEITRKLVMCIDKLKRYPSLTQSMQVLETFRQYVREGNERDSWPIERWMGKFMASKAKGGFRPNEIEYNAEKLSPFGMPFEGENTNETTSTQDDDLDDFSAIGSTESTEEDFFDQPEVLLDIISQQAENQPNNISVSPAECQHNQKLSEVNQQITHPKKGLNFGRRTAGKNNRRQVPPIHNSSSDITPSNVALSLGNVTLTPAEGKHLIHTPPANLNIEELVDNLTTENFKGESVSPETVAAYRQSLMLVMEGNLLDYEEMRQPEILLTNTALQIDNQHITTSRNNNTGRQ